MFAIFHHQLLKLPMSVRDKVPLRGLSCFPQQPDLNSTNGIITLHCARCFGFFCCFALICGGQDLSWSFWNVCYCFPADSCWSIHSLCSAKMWTISAKTTTLQFLREHQEHIYLMLELVVVIIFGTKPCGTELFSSDAFGCSGRFYLKGTLHQCTPSSFGFWILCEEGRAQIRRNSNICTQMSPRTGRAGGCSCVHLHSHVLGFY